MVDRPVVIIGGGPYGLAAAAHLKALGVLVRSFGEPLEFWRENMPAGMLLRSPIRATHIAHPRRELSIEEFEREQGRQLRRPSLTLPEFIDYASWYQRRAVGDLERRRVDLVTRGNGGFLLSLADGERFEASRVVVAAGLGPFGRRLAPFGSLPSTLVSHSADHIDLGVFAGREVVVIGAGQSALESAALLREGGATVEVIVRAPAIRWLADDTLPPEARQKRLIPIQPPPTAVGGRLTGWLAALPDLFRSLPRRLQPWVAERCIRAAGSGWLRPRLQEVPITCGREVVEAQPQGDAVRLVLDDGSERTVDHVLLGTGYQIDVSRYPFLGASLAGEIATVEGYPRLGPGLESSVDGLHFLGAPAAFSFGPIMRFVVGSWYAAPALAARVAGRRLAPLKRAF